jgi:hypothetical protein
MSVVINDIQVKRGHSHDWETKNYPLRSGEYGYEVDTGLFKIGNGRDGWNELPYFLNETEMDAKITAAIADVVAGSDPRVGDLADLTTQEKANLVGAINEVNTPGVAFTLLYENAKA